MHRRIGNRALFIAGLTGKWRYLRPAQTTSPRSHAPQAAISGHDNMGRPAVVARRNGYKQDIFSKNPAARQSGFVMPLNDMGRPKRGQYADSFIDFAGGAICLCNDKQA